MSEYTVQIKGLLLTGVDATIIPCLAIIGAGVVIGTTMYVGYKLSNKMSETIMYNNRMK